MSNYTPINYHRKVKKLKNLIRRYDEIAILNASTNYLYAPVNVEEEHIQRHPWVVLLLLKWCFLEKSRIEYRKDYLDNKKFFSLLNDTFQLSSLVRMPTEYPHHALFFRNMSYQQFIYQQPFSLSKYARQLKWFEKIPTNHRLKKRFKEICGLDCTDFLELSFVLVTKFSDMTIHTVEMDWFSPLFGKFGKYTVEKFLESLSVDIDRISVELRNVNQSKGGYEEYYEQTPFIRFPLIKHSGKFTCVHPYILYRRLENFIYDVLREDDPSRMMEYFSTIFESYLSIGLKYAGLDFLSENELRSTIPIDIKCVDYLVISKEANIFIDAKAIEMKYLGKITGNPDVVLGKVKNTALCAIEQANKLNEYIYSCEKENAPTFREKSYLLVVTCKELYLGSGVSFYESMAKPKIDALHESIHEKAIVDLKNIYFLNIDQFDYLMSISKEQSVPLHVLLDQVIQDDMNPASKKFDFSQHITSLGNNVAMPQYLITEVQNRLSKFKAVL